MSGMYGSRASAQARHGHLQPGLLDGQELGAIAQDAANAANAAIPANAANADELEQAQAQRKRTAAVLQHKSVEWYTPAWVFDALGLEFDLDPCSPHDMATAVPARHRFTVFDDGLAQSWGSGSVWLNPPYGPMTPQWMERMCAHGNGVAMVFSRTDAAWCQRAMASCDAMLFLAGRVDFVPGLENRHKESRAGAGTVMFAWGRECARALRRMSEFGTLAKARPAPRKGARRKLAGVKSATSAKSVTPAQQLLLEI